MFFQEWNSHNIAPKFEEMWVFVVEQGGAAEASIDGVNDAIDSITNTAVVLVADWFPEGEMALEQ